MGIDIETFWKKVSKQDCSYCGDPAEWIGGDFDIYLCQECWEQGEL